MAQDALTLRPVLREDSRMRSEDTQPANEESHEHEDEEFVSALVLTPRAPFLAWVAAQAPGEPPRDPVVVLTPELPTPGDRDTWLEQHHAAVFAAQLGAWHTEESAWPADRSLGALRAWFDVTWAPDVDDMRDLPIRPPVACGPVSLAALREEFAALAAGSELFLDVQTGEMVCRFRPVRYGIIGMGVVVLGVGFWLVRRHLRRRRPLTSS